LVDFIIIATLHPGTVSTTHYLHRDAFFIRVCYMLARGNTADKESPLSPQKLGIQRRTSSIRREME
jgi:hypothetical protein